MALLKPFDIATELVKEAQIAELPLDPREAAKLALNRNGASIEDGAIAISDCLADEKHRLNAARLVMEMHGAIEREKKSSVPSISINIVGADRTLVQLVTPR